MAMVDMACYQTGKPITLQQIAQRQNIAIDYLEQIFVKLKRSDLVRSVKGPGGGYLLTRAAYEIYISEIMLAVNSEFHMTRCNKNGNCMPNNVQCLTHHLWDDLSKNILDYLGSVSLADVISKQPINTTSSNNLNSLVI